MFTKIMLEIPGSFEIWIFYHFRKASIFNKKLEFSHTFFDKFPQNYGQKWHVTNLEILQKFRNNREVVFIYRNVMQYFILQLFSISDRFSIFLNFRYNIWISKASKIFFSFLECYSIFWFFVSNRQVCRVKIYKARFSSLLFSKIGGHFL